MDTRPALVYRDSPGDLDVPIEGVQSGPASFTDLGARRGGLIHQAVDVVRLVVADQAVAPTPGEVTPAECGRTGGGVVVTMNHAAISAEA